MLARKQFLSCHRNTSTSDIDVGHNTYQRDLTRKYVRGWRTSVPSVRRSGRQSRQSTSSQDRCIGSSRRQTVTTHAVIARTSEQIITTAAAAAVAAEAGKLSSRAAMTRRCSLGPHQRRKHRPLASGAQIHYISSCCQPTIPLQDPHPQFAIRHLSVRPFVRQTRGL